MQENQNQNQKQKQKYTLSILIENEFGALSRVAGLFSARGYNIESLTVAPTEDESLSRMTIVTSCSEFVLEQITKQLNKLVDVVKVINLTDTAHVGRELMLIKIRALAKDREELKRTCDIFRGKIVDVSENSYIMELVSKEIIDAHLLLNPNLKDCFFNYFDSNLMERINIAKELSILNKVKTNLLSKLSKEVA